LTCDGNDDFGGWITGRKVEIMNKKKLFGIVIVFGRVGKICSKNLAWMICRKQTITYGV
jgi:hypothetical protein